MKWNKLKNLAHDERGNVALMVSLALPALILIVGGGVDYANLLQRKTQLQNAVDSALLATHLHYQQDQSRSDAELKAYFDKHLKASLPSKLRAALSITNEQIQVDRKNGIMRAWVNAESRTNFMRLAAINKVKLSTFAEVQASPSYTEVALVLDTTGSMRGSKIAELKSAAKTFLNTIYTKLKGSKAENFKVAVVPFSMYVNVGTQYRNAPWISVPKDRKVYGRKYTWWQCWERRCKYYGYVRRRHCWWIGSPDGNRRKKICKITRDRICRRWEVKRLWPCKLHTWRPSATIRWKGCVGSRPYPLNIKDEQYGTRVPGVMERPRNPSYPEDSWNGWYWSEWNNCPTSLIPLTPLKTGKRKLITKINSLRAGGWTYIPSGLLWGWRVLSPQAPFSEGASWTEVKKKNVRKIIVLMTDGENTRAPDRRPNRAYFDHQSPDSRYADRLLTELCNNIKATNPATGKRYADIITVTFDVSDPNIKSLLKECSTLGSYDAKSGQLVKIFDTIAKSLAELHLSK